MSSYDRERSRQGFRRSDDRDRRERSRERTSSYDRGHRGRYPGYGHQGERNRLDDTTREGQKRGRFQRRGGRGQAVGRKFVKREEFVDSIVTRPKNLISKQSDFCETDQKIKLSANYFPISSMNPVAMKMYSIYFEPDMYNPKIRKLLVQNISKELGMHVYDESNTVYLLNEPQTTFLRTKMRDGKEFRINLKFRRDIKYTEGNFLQILNLIIRQSMKIMNWELIGRNHFDPSQSFSFPHAKLQMWPGFATAIRQHEHNLLLCCDSVHKVIRQETVLEMINALKRSTRGGSCEYMIKKKLIGTTVITTYNNRNYRIDDISFDENPLSTFSCANVNKSYLEYFSQQYGIKIRDARQPLLVSNPKNKDKRGGRGFKIKLIPELCCPVGLLDEMKNDFALMKELADKVRMTPEQRVQRLLKFHNRVQMEGNQPLIDNKLKIEKELVQFDGRKMPEQKIIFGLNINNEPIVVDLKHAKDTADWGPNLKDIVLYKAISVTKWVCIYPKTLEKQSKMFLDNFFNAGKKLGMKISEHFKSCPLPDDKNQSYIASIADCKAMDCKFMLIVVPNDNALRYQEIKTVCFKENPVLSQVIKLKTMEKKDSMSIATNVAIQINCKLGGIPWSVNIPVNGLLVVGFSITQDTNDKKEQYGAMVASLRPGKSDGTFFSCVNRHSRGSNISDYFGLNIIKLINKYKDTYKSLPERIIIYRDGIGDGAIQYVMEQEVSDVLSKLSHLYSNHGDQKPKLAFIIINKKINTRIFSRQNKMYDNPPPGTVVDDVITLPERYDFYLISQSVIQGTVAPTSYNIVHDSLGFQAKTIQLITYKLCHLYFNCSASVRVPSVVQYAQKLAFLFGQHLHSFDNSQLENMNSERQLYFL